MELTERMRRDLTQAMKERDHAEVSVLRTTLAAIANAEAPPMTAALSAPVVGQLQQHAPLELSRADVEQIIRDEIAERREARPDYVAAKKGDRVAVLDGEIAVLGRYLT